MKHIKTWQERVNEGDSIFAKATALEAEVAELRAYIDKLHKLPTAAELALLRNYTRPGESIEAVYRRLHLHEPDETGGHYGLIPPPSK